MPEKVSDPTPFSSKLGRFFCCGSRSRRELCFCYVADARKTGGRFGEKRLRTERPNSGLGPNKTVNQVQSEQSGLAATLFNKFYFVIGWLGFLAIALIYVSWPIRNFALVCWVYGSDAYYNRGIRVLPGKPVRFSNGELAPTLPDLVTGFAAFFITVGILTVLLFLVLRIYERYSNSDTRSSK